MHQASSLPTILALAALALTSACGDELTDPATLTESAEAEAVLRSAEALPSLPKLISAVDSVGEPARAILYHANQLWARGATADEPAGRTLRARALSRATPVLVRSVTPARWDEVEDGLEEWLGMTDRMLRRLRLPELERRARAGRRHLERARRASPTERPKHLLLSASELVETTPRFVAARMVAEAERKVALAASRTRRPLAGRKLERAERLKDWAARAVEGEEYLLAIQRAYYAIQLAEGG